MIAEDVEREGVPESGVSIEVWKYAGGIVQLFLRNLQIMTRNSTCLSVLYVCSNQSIHSNAGASFLMYSDDFNLIFLRANV